MSNLSNMSIFENDLSGASSIRHRISRAKLTFSRMLREPPPKRNDTPLNFNENINNSGFRKSSEISENLDIVESFSHLQIGSCSNTANSTSLPRKVKESKGRKFWKALNSDKTLKRPNNNKPVNISVGNSIVASRRSSTGGAREKSRNSLGGPLKNFGHFIPTGLGAILGGNRHSNAGIDFMTVFPSEIVSHIFSYLDHKSLLACELVSYSWYHAATCSDVWKRVFESENGNWKGCRYERDWKSMFEAKSTLVKRWRRGQITPSYLKGHTDSVYCVQFDGQKIISGSRDRTVRVWDIETGQCLKVIGRLRSDNTPTNSTDTPNGIDFHRGSILCLQFDAEILVTGSSDHTCIVYSLPNYTPIMVLPGHRMGVLDVCFDDKYIVSCSKDTTICVWERSTGLLLNRLRGHHGPVNAVQIRGNLLASASGDANIRLWDLETGNCIKTFTGHTRGLACIQFSEDGKTIISGGNDQSIRVWDVENGELRYEILDAHKSLVRSLYLDSEHGRIISGSYDQSVRVWDLETGRSMLNFPRWHGSWILAAKADAYRIISTSQDSQILVLDFSSGIRHIESLSR